MPLDRQAATPLYLQLYQLLRDSYEPQKAGHQKLWSIRKQAQNMQVSKTTVEQAYDQLVAEGYVYTVPGSGYYFNELQYWPQSQQATPPTAKVPAAMPPVNYDFRYGLTEILKPSWNGWKKAVRTALRQTEEQPAALYPEAQGLMALRKQLVTFLHQTRGVRCRADQIVITNGPKAGLELLLSLLPTGTIGIENPGYRGLTALAAGYGQQTVRIPVTPTGLDLAVLKRQQPQVVYTTPAHQFPLGYGMPIGARLDLLQWAADQHVLIVEDDYDSEYRYDAHPLPALQSLATADQVAYLGTFAKGIDPTSRMGYVVLPERLLAIYHQRYRYRSAMVAGLVQQAMVNYFESGAYYRHLSRSRSLNRQKYQLLAKQLTQSSVIQPILTGAGLHVVIRIPNIQQARLLAALARQSIRIYPLESNWAGMPTHDYYLLGFTALSLPALKLALGQLVQTCEQLAREK
ncbi:PLP-dependent aminotransferase family protein [Lactiplantibacillus sp. WILCCON 0030]|uniref:PLP-dependent aminotransferase family protein n=1 Tax=Lactiplantibacillus brownii TaxID=3069269 RepID=A0ABU1AC70_9LACO|nr:PLP-dependent aminotransferase family protein [Lactiplantibacillus brownii]MDQ7938017.1 PLP-dependent aminotransferase family protein [Lactiplantibacillus brownii]